MIEDINKQNINKRKKIWEVNKNYYCSIIGTCLSLEEVKKIFIKAGLSSAIKQMNDFDLHSSLISFLVKKNKISGIVQKTLDYKFKNEIDRYFRIGCATDLKELWKEDLSRGSVPGPYWAIMTHSVVEDDFLNAVFGEVHMLSHLNGHSIVADVQKLKSLEVQVEELESEKKSYKKYIKTLERERKTVMSLNKLIHKKDEELAAYKKENDSCKNGTTVSRLFDEIAVAVNMYKAEKVKNEAAGGELKNLKKEYADLGKKFNHVERENENYRKEIFYLEKELDLFITGRQVCDYSRAEQEQCAACDKEIIGKTILYVGGKLSVIPHCKAIVEKQGGTFIHHDGGVENRTGLLNQVISRADAVFCPLDCVSHDACNRVKKICRQKQKVFKLLRSSGISSFSFELHESFKPGEYGYM